MSLLDIANIILSLWLKPCVVLVTVLSLCTWSVYRSPQSCYWTMCALGSIALVCIPLSFLLPRIDLVFSSGFLPSLEAVNKSILDRIHLHAVWCVIAGVYSFVCVFLMGLHAYDFYQARSLVKRAIDLNWDDLGSDIPSATRVKIKSTTELISPVVWGVKQPLVLLPSTWESWGKGRLRRVLLHEFAHIERRDWLNKNVFYFVRAIFWFLTPVWNLIQRSALYAEYACDDHVILSGSSRADYAQDLLDFSSSVKLHSSFVAISGSDLATRINLVLDGGRERSQLSFKQKCVFIGLGFMLILPFYALTFLYENKAASHLVILSIDSTHKKVSEIADVPPVHLNILPKEEYLTAHQVYLSRYHENNSQSFVVDNYIEKLNLNVSQAIVVEPNFSVSIQGLSPSKLIYPKYPKKALSLGLEAKIEVEFDVDEQGRVFNIRYLDLKKGDEVFLSAISDALKQTYFDAPTITGRTVKYINAREVFVFKLEQ